MRLAFALLVVVAGGSACRRTAPPRLAGFLKGQLHAHSNRSADSNTPPAEVARWYAARGYDFVVLTDHNRVASPTVHGRLLVIPGIELTQNLERCEPAEGEHPCLLHLNALFVDPARTLELPPTSTTSRLELFSRALAASKALGGIAQINHPNFHYAAGVDLLVELARRGVRLVEIANQASDSNDAGDRTHPSTEALWDAAMGQGARLLGVASDDAHHYDDAPAAAARGETVFTGDRGFVMVRAARDPLAIRRAVERGDFYASTGVILSRLETIDGALLLELPSGAPPHELRCIGAGGRLLTRTVGQRARCELARGSAYVRAVVIAPDGRMAWTQPLWR